MAMSSTSARLDPATLSRSEFRETRRDTTVAAFVSIQKQYLKFFTSEGAKERAKWQSELGASGPTEQPGSISGPSHGSPLLVARASRANVDGTDAPGYAREKTDKPPRTPLPNARHDDNPEKAPAADCLDEHTLRLAERRERRRAKAAILKPKASPEKPQTSRKRKPDRPSPSPTPSRAASDDAEDPVREVGQGKSKKARSAKKLKVVPPTLSLLHSLAPNNIGRERLTLKPPSSIGVFNKGKASSKVEIKARPKAKPRSGTLVFSESRFFDKPARSTKRSSSVPSENPPKVSKPVVLTSGKHPTPASQNNEDASSVHSSSSESVVTSWSASPSRPTKAVKSPVQPSKPSTSDQPISTTFSTVGAKWRVEPRPHPDGADVNPVAEPAVDNGPKCHDAVPGLKDLPPAATSPSTQEDSPSIQPDEIIAASVQQRPKVTSANDGSHSEMKANMSAFARLPKSTSLQELIDACNTSRTAFPTRPTSLHMDVLSTQPFYDGAGLPAYTCPPAHLSSLPEVLPIAPCRPCAVPILPYDSSDHRRDMPFDPATPLYDPCSGGWSHSDPRSVLVAPAQDAFSNYSENTSYDSDSYMSMSFGPLDTDVSHPSYEPSIIDLDHPPREAVDEQYSMDFPDSIDFHNRALYSQDDDGISAGFYTDELFTVADAPPFADTDDPYFSDDTYDDQEDTLSISFATGRILLDNVDRSASHDKSSTRRVLEDATGPRPIWPRHKP